MIDSVLEGVTEAVVISTLVYASHRDLVSREIPEVSWIPAYLVALIGIALRPPTSYSVVEVMLAALPSLVYFAFFITGLMGGADLLAMVAITLAHLDKPLVPLFTFVLSSVAPLPLILANLIGNLTKYREVMRGINCVQGSKRVLYLVGRPTTVASFLSKKFAFLHTYPSRGGFVCRSSVDVNIDFEEQRAGLVEAIGGGLIKPGDHVIYSPALPHVVFIALSYVISVAIASYLGLVVGIL